MKFGEVDIAAIELDLKSRDDNPPLSFAVCNTYTPRQHYAHRYSKFWNGSFPRKADPRLGRPGMEQWKILVLAVLRLGLNTDYDRIHELANHHDTIRQMLGHGVREVLCRGGQNDIQPADDQG